MVSLFKYINARKRLTESNKTIEMLGGIEESPPLVLAQNDMISNEVTYFYYRFWYEVMIMLLFVAICGIIVECMNENDLRTLWGRIGSWYAQTVAWGQLQTETIYQSISR